jgi:hypothetical protein
MTGKLIWTFSDSWTESKTERDEQWLGSWYGHSVTCGRRVKRRETNNDWEVDMDIQWFVSISTSQSLFVSLRFTLRPRVTECPYQLPRTMTGKLIWTFSDSWTKSKTERDEQWLGSWYGHSVTRGRRVKRRGPRVTQCPYQLPSHCSSLSVLLSVHESLNVHINFPVIVRLSPFYSPSTSHWKRRETNNDWEVAMDIQWLVDGE